MKTDPIQKKDMAFAKQMMTFKEEVPTYATVLELSPEEVKQQADDAAYFNFTTVWQDIMQKGARQSTAWKDLMRDGGTPPAGGEPKVPAFPAAVPPVAPGIERRFRALVQRIKSHKNYNEAIGKALGIEGVEQAAPDLTAVQPSLGLSIVGNRVEVDWSWMGFGAFLDICEIQVDRGDGKGFGFLTFDSTPSYVDTQPFPPTPVKWFYRAIYRADDVQVGIWSETVGITVPQ